MAHELLAVLDRLACTRDSSTWVEKTAQHLHYLPFIESLQDDGNATHFVHVIRDGLETVSSLYVASRRWDTRSYRFARGAVPPYDLDTCVSRWNTDLAVSLERTTSPMDQFVFYEDLTTDAEATLAPVLRALGLSWEPGILERYAETAHGVIAPLESWKGVAPQIRRSQTSRQTLTAPERELVERSLRHDLYEQVRERVKQRTAA